MERKANALQGEHAANDTRAADEAWAFYHGQDRLSLNKKHPSNRSRNNESQNRK